MSKKLPYSPVGRGDLIADQHGEAKVMAVVENYLMVRRKGCVPFCVAIAFVGKQWKVVPKVQP